MSQLTRPPDSYPEEIREAFEYCDECEKVVVSVSQHTCERPGANRRKSAAERAQLAAMDDRPRDDAVVIPKGGSANHAWAYHELDAEGIPVHVVDHDAGHEVGTRAEAIEKGCYPCGTCRLIAERQEDEADG